MKRISILGRTIAGAALSVALAAPAGAGTIYSWRTDDGGYAFADDLRRVPEYYKDRVETRESASLTGHDRYTPHDDAAVAQRAAELDHRVETMRKRNQHLQKMLAATSQANAGSPGVTVRLDSRGQPIIDIPPGGGRNTSGPVIIEDVLAKPDGAINTRRNTVIRQGDEVIAVVRPLHTQSPSFKTESQIESGEGF
jgi:hypothetical protein